MLHSVSSWIYSAELVRKFAWPWPLLLFLMKAERYTLTTLDIFTSKTIKKQTVQTPSIWVSCGKHGGYKSIVSLMPQSRNNYKTSTSGLILGLRPTNERRRYFVMTSLIGWAQASNQPCTCLQNIIWCCVCHGNWYPVKYSVLSKFWNVVIVKSGLQINHSQSSSFYNTYKSNVKLGIYFYVYKMLENITFAFKKQPISKLNSRQLLSCSISDTAVRSAHRQCIPSCIVIKVTSASQETILVMEHGLWNEKDRPMNNVSHI